MLCVDSSNNPKKIPLRKHAGLSIHEHIFLVYFLYYVIESQVVLVEIKLDGGKTLFRELSMQSRSNRQELNNCYLLCR